MANALRVCGLAGLTVFVLHSLGGGGDGGSPLIETWLYTALLWLGAATCLLGSFRTTGRERVAWLFITAGVAVWALGDLYWTLVLADDPTPPYPSIGDALYATFYPLVYVGLFLLVSARSRGLARSVWLDGAIAAAGAATVAVALVFEFVVTETDGSIAVVATNLVYPVGDVLLLALVAGMFVLERRQLDRCWLLIGAGLVAIALADIAYLVQTATESYVEGTVLDALWPAAMLLIAQAPWARRDVAQRPDVEGKPLLAIPALAGALAMGVLVYDHVARLGDAAIVLAAMTLALVLLRTGLAFRENRGLLERNRVEAVTDALTGMGNRRRLLRDLEVACFERRAALLMIFDLDGFKHYNDTFGHPAGDALLVRLGGRLSAAVHDWATTYRLGGDEFCLLGSPEDPEAAVDAAARALCEDGEGFEITSSFGAVFLPGEAASASAALTVADQRLYAHKRAKQHLRGRPHDVLLQALYEREPDLHEHTNDVARLARAIGEQLGLEGEALERLGHAALLHDIGKIAVPDSILHKAGPLDAAERAFIQRHTIVGERILAASPALRRVGSIVRSSHERWDGQGYPDGLAGEAIPLEARIVAVCDAYSAITSHRPYRAAAEPDEALAEIERCAGTQFDPIVAAALRVVVTGRVAAA